MNSPMILNVVKIFLPTALTFAVGILLTPRLTSYMYKYKLWKKKARSEDEGITNDDFKKINNSNEEISTPRVGGVIIWLSVLISISLIWIISKAFPSDLSAKLDFFSRSQTLIPLGSLLFGSLLGLIDDAKQIRGAKDAIGYRYTKIATIVAIGILIASWLYFKVGMTAIAIPFSTSVLPLGFLFIPFFILILVAVFCTKAFNTIIHRSYISLVKFVSTKLRLF
jgi:UDP-N-acetylmuramyl pentapeptide phosphotransferase/UDP-N-acetylglucosamine-1-phosphate transferase